MQGQQKGRRKVTSICIAYRDQVCDIQCVGVWCVGKEQSMSQFLSGFVFKYLAFDSGDFLKASLNFRDNDNFKRGYMKFWVT